MAICTFEFSAQEASEPEIERIARMLCNLMEGSDLADCEVMSFNGELMRSATGRYILPHLAHRVPLWKAYSSVARAEERERLMGACSPSFSIGRFLRELRYEPTKRWCGGSYGWVMHRFPIKGGISPREVMVRNFTASNALLLRLKEKEAGA